MAKKRDIREGDVLTIKVRVVRVSDDGEQVTIAPWGRPTTGPAHLINIVKQEKGSGWPN